MGRATFTFPKDKQDAYLQSIREGMRRGAAADIVFNPGESNPTLRRQVRDYIEEHPDFERLVLDAEVDATENVEEALYQAAVSGNVSAAKTWLEIIRGPAAKPAVSGRPSSPSPGEDPDYDDDDLYNVTPIRRR